jgi:hypothetical protein
VKAGSGSATVKVGPGSAKSSAYCPDGSLVANHPNGCPKR